MKPVTLYSVFVFIFILTVACASLTGCPAKNNPATPTAVINFDIQVNPCGTIVTLDGGQPATLTGNKFFPSVYTNVPLGQHVIGLDAGSVSISCTENILITYYSLEVITPCTALSCSNVLPE
jgi:hypothetical protein